MRVVIIRPFPVIGGAKTEGRRHHFWAPKAQLVLRLNYDSLGKIYGPLVLRLNYDLLGEIYGPLVLRLNYDSLGKICGTLVLRLTYDFLGEIYGQEFACTRMTHTRMTRRKRYAGMTRTKREVYDGSRWQAYVISFTNQRRPMKFAKFGFGAQARNTRKQYVYTYIYLDIYIYIRYVLYVLYVIYRIQEPGGPEKHVFKLLPELPSRRNKLQIWLCVVPYATFLVSNIA